jgi:activator of 2-hydroxyglutaryl-CoA dehydratase
MKYALGIDVGSSLAKAVVFGETLLSYAVMPSGGNYAEVARKVCEAAIEKAGIANSDLIQDRNRFWSCGG